MYYTHFGLSRPPFRITPDPELFFPGGNRGAVLEALSYAITNGEGIVKVVGEVGSGKTMLCRMLERELPDDCDIIYLANPSLSPDNIVQAIAFELGLASQAAGSKLEVMHRVQDYLLEKHANGQRVVMFVEEAQGMPVETLEELRLLSNLETSRDKLLQIVLFGQPELEDKLNQHRIRQLRERITYSFALPPFHAGQIRDYLVTRLRASGYRGNVLFTNGAIRAVARYSEGLLRRINVLADKALLAAYADNQHIVDVRHVRRAANDSAFIPRRWWWRPVAVFGVTAIVVIGAMFGWFYSRERADVAAAATAVTGAPVVSSPGSNVVSGARSAQEEFPVNGAREGPSESTTGDAIVALSYPGGHQGPITESVLTLAEVRRLAARAGPDKPVK